MPDSVAQFDPASPAPALDIAVSDQAFERLYLEHWSALINYAMFRIGPDEAEDIVADAFARAWAHRSDFRSDRGSPDSWLWGIVRNSITDRQRRLSVRGRAATPAEKLPVDVSDEVARLDELRGAARAIAKLPELDQEIIALRFGAGLMNREIAGRLGRTEGNVALRLHRAFRKVRVALQKGGDR
jgi:RNA polymerase sigma-70 factor (ECF subfamily)